MYYAYVLQSQKNKRYYYGCTKDLDRRLSEHDSGKSKAAKYMRPWKLVHIEKFSTLSESRKRERFFKSGKGRDYIRSRAIA